MADGPLHQIVRRPRGQPERLAPVPQVERIPSRVSWSRVASRRRRPPTQVARSDGRRRAGAATYRRQSPKSRYATGSGSQRTAAQPSPKAASVRLASPPLRRRLLRHRLPSNDHHALDRSPSRPRRAATGRLRAGRARRARTVTQTRMSVRRSARSQCPRQRSCRDSPRAPWRTGRPRRRRGDRSRRRRGSGRRRVRRTTAPALKDRTVRHPVERQSRKAPHDDRRAVRRAMVPSTVSRRTNRVMTTLPGKKLPRGRRRALPHTLRAFR